MRQFCPIGIFFLFVFGSVSVSSCCSCRFVDIVDYDMMFFFFFGFWMIIIITIIIMLKIIIWLSIVKIMIIIMIYILLLTWWEKPVSCCLSRKVFAHFHSVKLANFQAIVEVRTQDLPKEPSTDWFKYGTENLQRGGTCERQARWSSSSSRNSRENGKEFTASTL